MTQEEVLRESLSFFRQPDSLARAAALLDVASGLFLRADLASDSLGERAMLVSQLSAMRSDDLLVLDRAQEAKAGNRANTGVSGKKTPTDKGWDFGKWWWNTELNPRP